MSQNVQMSLFSDAVNQAITAYNTVNSINSTDSLTPLDREESHEVKDFGEVIFGAAKMIRVYSKQDLGSLSNAQLLKIKKQNIYDVIDLGIEHTANTLSALIVKALYKKIRNPKIDRTGTTISIREDVEGFTDYMIGMYPILKDFAYNGTSNPVYLLNAIHQEKVLLQLLKSRLKEHQNYSWSSVDLESSFLHMGVAYQTIWSWILDSTYDDVRELRIKEIVRSSVLTHQYSSKKVLEMDIRLNRWHLCVSPDDMMAEIKALPSAEKYYLCYLSTDTFQNVKFFTSQQEVNDFKAIVTQNWIDKMSTYRNEMSYSALSSRKATWKPITLSAVDRVGPTYRIENKNINGADFMLMFNVRGGQYGSSMNDEERQNALNHAYDAFMDLADVLHVDPKAISLNGTLGIAFGARGHGNALAHYEPTHRVINLTKMKGAGSLAHEWFHAFDHALCIKENPMTVSLLSDLTNETTGSSLSHLLDVIKYDDQGNSTEYMKRSQLTAQTTIGYWTKNCELLARAFNCYVYDKLKEMGRNSDYLCGMAYEQNTPSLAFSSSEEKKRIYDAFDALFKEWRDEI